MEGDEMKINEIQTLGSSCKQNKTKQKHRCKFRGQALKFQTKFSELHNTYQLALTVSLAMVK